jgi:hypothetical protein
MSTLCENNTIQPIDLNETIGLSLYTLNNNFLALKESVCDLDTTYGILEDRYFFISNLSDSLVIQQNNIIKAKVSFDCTRDTSGTVTSTTSDRLLYSNFNVDRVQRLASPDRYRIFFKTGLNLVANQYGIIGTNDLTTSQSDAWVQPLSDGYNASHATISILNTTGTYFHPEYVSIIIL